MERKKRAKSLTWKKDLLLVLKQSVITGVPEYLNTRKKCQKILRFCVFIICLIGFLYYTWIQINIYWKYQTVMDVTVEYPEEVDVPAVTICSHNGLSASEFCRLHPDLCSPLLMNYTDFCKENYYFCNANYIYPENVTFPVIIPYGLPQKEREYYRSLGNRDTDLIESCQIIFPTYSRPCINRTTIVDVFDTMGLPNNCYTINSYVGLSEKEIKKMPSKTYINIKIKTSVKDAFYTSTPAVFQVSIHNTRVLVNPFKKGISVKPCYNYFIYPSKVVNILMAAPYDTNCTDYEKAWKARGGIGPLSQTQCREECLLNASMEDLHCVDPFYIVYPTTAPICDQPVYGNKYFKKCLHLCSRACYREDILTDVEEHASLLARENKDAADECKSVLTLAFSRMEVKTFKYFAKYQGIEMFGNIGGILGVWLGISLMAITDVLETCYVIFCHIKKIVHRKKIRKEIMKAEKLFNDCYHCDSKGNFTLKIY